MSVWKGFKALWAAFEAQVRKWFSKEEEDTSIVLNIRGEETKDQTFAAAEGLKDCGWSSGKRPLVKVELKSFFVKLVLVSEDL